MMKCLVRNVIILGIFSVFFLTGCGETKFDSNTKKSIVNSSMREEIAKKAEEKKLTRVPVNKEDLLYESKDFEEIKACEEEILSRIEEEYKDAYENGYVKEMPEAFPKEIDYSEAVKIYYFGNLRYDGASNESEVMEILKQNQYKWEIPVLISGETVKVALTKDFKSSQTDATSKLEKEEEWKIFISRDSEKSHLSYLSTKLDIEEYDRIVFIAGSSGCGMTMTSAIAFCDGKIEGWMALDSQGYDFEELSANEKGLYDYNEVIEERRRGMTGCVTVAPEGKEEYLFLLYVIGLPVICAALLIGGIYIYRLLKRKNMK